MPVSSDRWSEKPVEREAAALRTTGLSNLVACKKKGKVMAKYVEASGLRVEEELYHLVRDEIAPGTGVESGSFWAHRSQRL